MQIPRMQSCLSRAEELARSSSDRPAIVATSVDAGQEWSDEVEINGVVSRCRTRRLVVSSVSSTGTGSRFLRPRLRRDKTDKTPIEKSLGPTSNSFPSPWTKDEDDLKVATQQPVLRYFHQSAISYDRARRVDFAKSRATSRNTNGEDEPWRDAV